MEELPRITDTFGPLLEGQSSELISRLHRGLKWLHESRHDLDLSDRLIRLFSSLEAMLCEGIDKVRSQLAERIPLIVEKRIGLNPHEHLHNRIKKLYGKRSGSVHGGYVYVDSSEVMLLNHITVIVAWALPMQ